jgi:3-hydroxybutyrate dehydrogenase
MDRLLSISKELTASPKSKNRVALVTGSLSGIGLGIAHALAKRGYNIILNGFAPQSEIDRIS